MLGELGRGGMAQVYRALHEPLQREVAIKELLPDSLKDKQALSRFRREALALATFRHENIVTIYDLVEKSDGLFMVMELVDGPTLSELVKEGPLPPDVAAVIAASLAAALDHAHFNRIIHRDLKPGNVMITKTGEVKLMDFGIAKDDDLAALTKTGVAIGTPSYMSPEQIGGEPLDPRTDIFSLGVVLYQCLTGQKPFVGESAGEVFARIREGKYKKVRRVAPRVPKALERVVVRALKVKPNARYFDAAQLRRELELYLAREVRMSHAALLMAYLRYRGKISETEALARLTVKELEISVAFERPPPARSSFWGWAAAGTLLAACATAVQLWGPGFRAISIALRRAAGF